MRRGEDETAIGRHEPGADTAAGLDLHDRRKEACGRVGERLVGGWDRRSCLVGLDLAAKRGDRREQGPKAVARDERPGTSGGVGGRSRQLLC
jgi:hypothetical protein